MLLVADGHDIEVSAEAGDGADGARAIARSAAPGSSCWWASASSGEHDASWLIRSVRERFPGHAVLAVGANADPTHHQPSAVRGRRWLRRQERRPAEFLTRSIVRGEREMVLAGPTSGPVGRSRQASSDAVTWTPGSRAANARSWRWPRRD